MKPVYYVGNDGLEPIDLINAFNLNFNLGNVIKYVVRAGKKSDNAIEDLEKAGDYLFFEINRLDQEKRNTPVNGGEEFEK